MPQRELISAGMLAQGLRNVSRRGKAAGEKKQSQRHQPRARRNHREHACAAPYPIASHRHRRTQKQRKRGIARHRIIFLRGREGEEDQHKASPTERQKPRSARAIDGFKGKLGNGGKIHAPGKQPHQVQQPEVKARHGIVVSRIAQIQKAEQLLIDEEEPKKSMILPWPAVKREGEVGWIAQRGQNVPGRGDEQDDQQSAEGMQPPPGRRQKKAGA